MSDQPKSVPPVPSLAGLEYRQTRDSGLAIASLITGIIGWILVPLLGTLAAIITGHLAKREIKESNGALGGSGMATAGLILGYVQLAFIVILLVALIIFLFVSPQVAEIMRGASLGI